MKTTDNAGIRACVRAFGLALLALPLGACINYQGVNEEELGVLVERLSSALQAAGAGAGSVQPRAPGKFVQIYLDKDRCPTGLSNPNVELELDGRERFDWRTWDELANEPIDTPFCVFFDPFTGRADNRCTANGTLNSRRLATNGPFDPGEDYQLSFKYTIIVDACPEKPLDPWITVRN
jgi:hypothetical protein